MATRPAFDSMRPRALRRRAWAWTSRIVVMVLGLVLGVASPARTSAEDAETELVEESSGEGRGEASDGVHAGSVARANARRARSGGPCPGANEPLRPPRIIAPPPARASPQIPIGLPRRTSPPDSDDDSLA